MDEYEATIFKGRLRILSELEDVADPAFELIDIYRIRSRQSLWIGLRQFHVTKPLRRQASLETRILSAAL
ncbi:hypothetical protein [Maridesulfovibrio sp.]|uniref:hypothetical protein n=1 Tax=Maridesulfovibrio sp. TaxID=2795000 RepID=UPI003AFFFE5F